LLEDFVEAALLQGQGRGQVSYYFDENVDQ
jgi:hypothetical protein